MPMLGVIVAIINDGQILLTQRDDFHVWCLPGGGVDPGESVAQAAVREAWEETGLQVEVTQLVGIYSRPKWSEEGSHQVLFTARPVSGVLRLAAGETVDVSYFDPVALPAPLLQWHQQPITDALSGAGGSLAWALNNVWPFPPGMSREEIYTLRDRSGLTRQQFYLHYYTAHEQADKQLEVGEQRET